MHVFFHRMELTILVQVIAKNNTTTNGYFELQCLVGYISLYFNMVWCFDSVVYGHGCFVTIGLIDGLVTENQE